MKITFFQTGMTVIDLKRLVADWPETNEYGEPSEVWLTNGNGVFNQAKAIIPLGIRYRGSEVSADLMLSSE